MSKLYRRAPKQLVLFSAALALAGLTMFLTPSGSQAGSAAGSQSVGAAQLLSIQPLPGEAGEITLMTALEQQREARAASVAARSARTEDHSQDQPVRWIRDPWAAFSSVAVDPINDEVILTDENLFQILVYDRTANTPPQANFTEPKRILAGLQTKIEFQCGLYIDPQNGDIYAVNNDTVDTLVIFDRDSNGDVPPTRELHTPHGTFGIAVDERCCMDRGGDGIRPFPSGSVRRYARTQAVRVRSLCSGLFGRVGSP